LAAAELRQDSSETRGRDNVSKTDDYLKKIADALNNYDSRTAGALVEEIASVFSECRPKPPGG
jgi:hypothetical protein